MNWLSWDEKTWEGYAHHLQELRARLIRGLIAVAVGMVAGWIVYPWAFALLTGPVTTAIAPLNGKIIVQGPAEGFLMRTLFAAVLGVALASPYALWQVWAFIVPGLTTRERRVVAPLVPAVACLFLIGMAVAYAMLPHMLYFLLLFTPTGVEPLFSFQTAMSFPLKMMLAFGLLFELPILLLGLVWLGVLLPETLLKQWRVAVLLITIIAAVIVPSPDAVSVLLLMAPLIVLYFLTVLIAYRIKKPGKEAQGEK